MQGLGARLTAYEEGVDHVEGEIATSRGGGFPPWVGILVLSVHGGSRQVIDTRTCTKARVTMKLLKRVAQIQSVCQESLGGADQTTTT